MTLQTFSLCARKVGEAPIVLLSGLTEQQVDKALKNELYRWQRSGFSETKLEPDYYRLTKTTGRWWWKQVHEYEVYIKPVWK